MRIEQQCVRVLVVPRLLRRHRALLGCLHGGPHVLRADAHSLLIRPRRGPRPRPRPLRRGQALLGHLLGGQGEERGAQLGIASGACVLRQRQMPDGPTRSHDDGGADARRARRRNVAHKIDDLLQVFRQPREQCAFRGQGHLPGFHLDEDPEHSCNLLPVNSSLVVQNFQEVQHSILGLEVRENLLQRRTLTCRGMQHRATECVENFNTRVGDLLGRQQYNLRSAVGDLLPNVRRGHVSAERASDSAE
mmetsp:Transcript_162473/g.520767  ORF Transcript_162473/g.520767 Transcript_162473/m.520767 type:complete len:248 (+) Transcript_162473:1213-1956(+)